MKYIMILLLILLAGCAGHKEGDCYTYGSHNIRITRVGEHGVNVDYKRDNETVMKEGYLSFSDLAAYYNQIDCFGVF